MIKAILNFIFLTYVAAFAGGIALGVYIVTEAPQKFGLAHQVDTHHKHQFGYSDD